MKRGLVRLAPMVIMFVLGLAPSSSAAIHSESFPVNYVSNFTDKETTLLKHGPYVLAGTCRAGEGVLLEVTAKNTNGHATVSALGGNPTQPVNGGGSYETPPVKLSVQGRDNGVEQAVGLLQNGAVFVVESLSDTTVGGKDCTLHGVFTLVRGRERIFRQMSHEVGVVVDQMPDSNFGVYCGSTAEQFTASANQEKNAFAASYLPESGPAEDARFPLPEAGDTVLAPLSLGVTTFNVSEPDGRVTSLLLGSYVDDDPYCTISGRARSVTGGSSRVFYAKNASNAPKRKEFYDKGGLHLSASGQLKVFAATDSKHAILHTSVLGDGPPTVVAKDDFSSKPSKPLFLLDFEGISRSGELVYARPGGRVTTLDWSGAQVGGAYRDCLFYGLTTTAS